MAGRIIRDWYRTAVSMQGAGESGQQRARTSLLSPVKDDCAAAVGRADHQAHTRDPPCRRSCARALGRACARVVREQREGSRGEGVGLSGPRACARRANHLAGFSGLLSSPVRDAPRWLLGSRAFSPRRVTSQDFCSLPSGIWELREKKKIKSISLRLTARAF